MMAKKRQKPNESTYIRKNKSTKAIEQLCDNIYIEEDSTQIPVPFDPILEFPPANTTITNYPFKSLNKTKT